MDERRLPWPSGLKPLMLAPMQGVTNRGLRSVFGQSVKPDVLFTEFVRVRPGAKQPITHGDIKDVCTTVPGIPLVVQLIGCAGTGLLEAAQTLVARGVRHINLNMGCPFGRMASHLSGGGMFREPQCIEPMLKELRAVVPGSLSVKTRSGFDDPRQILDLVPAFESAQIDFMVIHPRTVVQKYTGDADHGVTRELVSIAPFPVIANGDIRDCDVALQVLERTEAAGLMLGRGAIADPWLFERIRGNAPASASGVQRQQEIARHFERLMQAYLPMFCGEAQVLTKLKEALRHVEEPELIGWLKPLLRAKRLDHFEALLTQCG